MGRTYPILGVVHKRLTRRARESHMSLSDYLLAELQKASEQPAPAEILARLAKLRPVASRSAIVRALRKGRNRA